MDMDRAQGIKAKYGHSGRPVQSDFIFRHPGKTVVARPV